MKTKKIASVLLIFCITASLFGCGSSVPTINDNMSEESSEIVEGSIDGIEETTGAEERETTVIPEPTDAPTSTVTSNPMHTPMAEPTSEPTASPEPTEPPHLHQYTETVRKQASCAEAGEKTLVCECGDSKVEAIPATGNHNWVEEMQTITHPSTGHVEQRETQVQTGSRKYQVYECALCGFQSDTASGVTDHRAEYAAQGIRHTGSTLIYDHEEPIYESRTEDVWIVDQESWDEIVGSGTYTCTVCGATK